MQSIVDSCGCHNSKASKSRNRGLLSSLTILYCANSLLYVALIHGMPSFDGYHGSLVRTCGLSCFAGLCPWGQKITGGQIVKVLVDQWSKPYRAPKKVHSDNAVRIWSDTGYCRTL